MAGGTPVQETPRAAAIRLSDADDDLPEGVDTFEIGRKVLSKRLDRAGKKKLRDLFGTDDEGQVKQILEEHKQMKEAAEAQRLQQMSDLERERELRTRAEQERDTIRSERDQERQRRMVDAEQRKIEKALGSEFQPKYLNHILYDLKNDVDELEDGMTPAQEEKWLKDWMARKAEEFPEYTKRAASKPDPVPVPMNNGTPVVAPTTNHLEGGVPEVPGKGSAAQVQAALDKYGIKGINIRR